MELPGSAYLYTLATLSMTFAGFSAIAIVLRQTIGKVVVSLLVTVGLVGNVLAIPFEPSVLPVAIAATWTLVCGATVFILSLGTFWEVPRAN